MKRRVTFHRWLRNDYHLLSEFAHLNFQFQKDTNDYHKLPRKLPLSAGKFKFIEDFNFMSSTCYRVECVPVDVLKTANTPRSYWLIRNGEKIRRNSIGYKVNSNIENRPNFQPPPILRILLISSTRGNCSGLPAPLVFPSRDDDFNYFNDLLLENVFAQMTSDNNFDTVSSDSMSLKTHAKISLDS